MAAGGNLVGSQEIHGGHERGDRHHHHQVALHDAYLAHHPAIERSLRQMGRHQKLGVKKVYTMVSDYGPGIDAEQVLPERSRRRRRGTGLGSHCGGQPGFLRLCAAGQGPQPARHLHLRAGRLAAGGDRQGVGRARYHAEKHQNLGRSRSPSRTRSSAMGDAAFGIITSVHYDYNHASKMNEDFVAAYNAEFHRDPDIFSISSL